MTLDAVSLDSKELSSPWRAAEAYHFWLLAHRQLYGGQVDALRTALHLRAYEDILGAREVYSFLALAGFYGQYYRQCSRAFIKLEGLQGLDEETRSRLGDLALAIFAANSPQDPSALRADELLAANVREDMCVATGRLLKGQPAVRCRVCRHQALQTEAQKRECCPLCHTAYQGPCESQAAAVLSLSRPERPLVLLQPGCFRMEGSRPSSGRVRGSDPPKS